MNPASASVFNFMPGSSWATIAERTVIEHVSRIVTPGRRKPTVAVTTLGARQRGIGTLAVVLQRKEIAPSQGRYEDGQRCACDYTKH